MSTGEEDKKTVSSLSTKALQSTPVVFAVNAISVFLKLNIKHSTNAIFLISLDQQVIIVQVFDDKVLLLVLGEQDLLHSYITVENYTCCYSKPQ